MDGCPKGTILVVDNSKRGRSMLIPLLCGRVCGENACGFCWKKRAKQIMRQVNSGIREGDLYWRIVSTGESKNLLRSLKDGCARYKRLPQENGRVAFITDDNQRLKGEPMPCDQSELEALIKQLARTPKGERQSSSKGFGGKHANMRSKSDKTVYSIAAHPSVVKKYLTEAGAFWGSEDSDGIVWFSGQPEVHQRAIDKMESALIEVSQKNAPAV